MLWHASSCHTTPHHHHGTLHNVTPCHAMSHHARKCHTLPHFARACYSFTPCHTKPIALPRTTHTLSLLFIHPYPTGNAGDSKLHTMYLLPPLEMMPASLLCLTVALWWPLMQRNSAFIALESINSCNDLTLSLLDVASPVVTL